MNEYAGDPMARGRFRCLPKRFLLSLFAALFLIVGPFLSAQKKPLPDVPAPLRDELKTYLRTHGLSPEDYVVGKFREHDIVFLGEHHFIKHDVEFVQSLLPLLYRNGVRDLGIEFGCHELQPQADALVTAATYDEGLARRLMFQWASYWPYVEYRPEGLRLSR